MNMVMEKPDLQARAAYYLSIWSDWFRRDDTRLGYPSKVALIRTDGGYWDSDEQASILDDAAARAADAVLQDIDATHSLALMDQYLAAVVRFQRRSDERLREAHETFALKMAKRGFP